MAIKTITKNCPFCKKVYEQHSFHARGRTITPEERWKFGNPTRMCPHCKKLFLDPDIQELAVTGLRKQDKALVNPQTVHLTVIGLLLGALMYVCGLPVFGYIAAGVGVLCVIADMALYPYRMKKLETERKASEKRLADPAYARMLKKAGYDIPEKYLKTNDKEGAEA